MLNVYLYTVSSISLIVFYFAGYVMFDAMLRFLFGVETGLATRQAIAAGLGYSAITFPLWRIHWQWLRQHVVNHAAAGIEEIHRRYLFIVTGVNIVAMLFGGGISIMSLAQLVLSASEDVGMTCVNVGRALFIFLLSTALWLHHWQEFDAEERGQGARLLGARVQGARVQG